MIDNAPAAETHVKVDGTTFGQLASSYASGRKEYPRAVFDTLAAKIQKNASILELGCGTGLATKQLYDHSFCSVIATDIDPRMVQAARQHCPKASFLLVDGRTLPFADHMLDAIVAFGCFHWFCTPQAVLEIKRALKPTGIFFVVNKRDTGPFREQFRAFLEELEGKPIIEPKAQYRPVDMLERNKFTVSVHKLQEKELFAKEELLAYAQSISLWTSLSAEKRKKYTPALLQFLDGLLQGKECYERPIEVQCISALINRKSQKAFYK